MLKFRVAQKTSFGEVSAEADSVDELKGAVSDFERLRDAFSPRSATSTVTGAAGEDGAEIVPSDWSPRYLKLAHNEIRFPAAAFDTLNQDEAISVLLHDYPRPLGPAKIAGILSAAWKPISPATVRFYLTSKKSRLVKMKLVVKLDSGYHLSGAGERWVGDSVSPKLVGRSVK